jgi:YVTN family beta-propeller protein
MAPGQPDEPVEGLIDEILAAEPTAEPPGDQSELLTFVIADIRGYTTFTHERGDEAAARLTARFAALVRELVAQFGGTVFELRGDEALCVFPSPRQSLRLAIALQLRFVEEMTADPTLPLAVGIGVDAGEAVRSADGYRGGALNLAARLCSRAKAGEVLASQEVTHLARRIDGINYVPGESVTLKGLSEPVRLVRVLPDGVDPAERIAALLPAAAPAAEPVAGARPWLRSRSTMIAAAAIVAAAVAVSVVLVNKADDAGGHQLAAFGENSVGVIDPGNRHLVAQLGVDLSPTAGASGFGAVWAANTGANTVSRIDESSRQVIGTIPVGSAPSAVAIGPDAVWVTNSGAGTVSRIDPKGGPTQTIEVGSSPGGVVVAFGAVWVANTSNGTVSRIDPSRNVVTKTISVGEGPSGIAAGRDIWVANSVSNTVSEIDPASASVIQTIHVGNDPRDVLVVGNDVWVSLNLDGTIARIPSSGTSVTDTVTVPAEPTKLAAIDGELWVATQADRAVAEVDLKSHRVDKVSVGATPTALVAVPHNDELWVTTSIDPSLHTGGTLRLAGREPGSIDPSYVASPWTAWLLSGSYDALVAYRHANGAGGTAIVPDLATAIPDPTNGGRTYTFRLRSGVRWSTGSKVTVLDVQRGLLRLLAAGYSALRHEIAGGAACSPARCTVPGIAVDASAGTVTITLRRPSADFLDLLSSAVAVPADTPFADQHRRPIAATGPYQVLQDDGTHVVLTRNRNFTQWSSAAQPAGFPDRIEYDVVPNDDPKIAARRVADGDADWADIRGAAPLGTLEARFGNRLYVSPTLTSHGVELNTRVPPFDDPRVRRALSYAVDRDAVADDWFTPAAPTCQLLPPNFPGYRPYCPYTLPADAPGTWRAPDYPTAKRLVDASHTAPMRVVVWATPSTAPGVQHVVDALNELGYHAKLSVYENPDYFEFISDSRNHVQAAFFGWVADNTDAVNFFQPFTCDAFTPADPLNPNAAEFCDPAFDRLTNQAALAETQAPDTAADLWAGVDKRLTDDVPWLGLVTPTWVDAVSPRVHDYVRSSIGGVYFDQMWVR